MLAPGGASVLLAATAAACWLLPLLQLATFPLTVRATPLSPSPGPAEAVVLSDFIRHFEAATYDREALVAHQRERRRRRRRRDSGPGPPLRLTLTAGSRRLDMRLVPDEAVFSDDVEFEGPHGAITFDRDKAYVGWLEGDERAIVQGVVTSEGLFDGSVTTAVEELFIEPANRYLRRPPPGLHTVFYTATDVQPPPSLQLPCASQLLYLNRSRRTLPEELELEAAAKAAVLVGEGARLAEDEDAGGDATASRHVRKRAAVDPRKTTCMLYLQADHFFHEKYGSEEACIEVMTRHVQRVNSIYKATDFNQDGRADNISFMIKRIKVYTRESRNDPTYRFPLNYGVEKFLELFSEEDYDAFCLAYMFTYRDFEMGTLGLAWTGDLKNAGGVCEKNGLYRGSMKSLNTGIVTLLNYGKQVPPAVSHVTLAHEIGHNFGSPHDPDQCTPGGEDGNFIMFARATSGDKRNNNKFSPCSLNSINPVLNAKARSAKGCFTEPQAALCGNGVVETGEECDCGWEEDCRDRCCHPQRRHAPPGERPCSLAAGAACSPSQGPCCTATCELKFGELCREDNGCRDPSFCDGRGPICPPSVNKPNKTVCNDEFVCFMGECTGSICLAYGLESCQCLPGPHDPKTKACELCCKEPGDGAVCKSSFEWNTYPLDIPDMYSKPGTPCNNYNGYCDVFQKCREVDPSGPLATLRKLLLSDESIASFKRWVTDHWYAVLFIVLGFIFLLVASTRVLGKRPESKLKAVTIIHSSTTETVRLPPEDGTGSGGGPGTGAVTVHPAAVRCKLPLKRRVREARDRHRGRPRKATSTSASPAKASPVKKPSAKKKKKKKPPSSAAKAKAKAAKVSSPSEKVTSPSKEALTTPTTPTTASAPLPAPRASKPKKTKPPPVAKVKKKPSSSANKKKEVIDYSALQEKQHGFPVLGLLGRSPTLAPEHDPVGKVKNWLLNTHQVVDTALIPKSKSTPVELTAGGAPTTLTPVSPVAAAPVATATIPPALPPRSPVKARPSRHRPPPDKSRSLSTGNLQSSGGGSAKKDCEKDRVRLQVVYKPPFKFSLKLRRAEKSSGATVVVERGPRRSTTTAEAPRGGKRSGATSTPGTRTALLVKQRDRHRGRANHRKVQPTASGAVSGAAKEAAAAVAAAAAAATAPGTGGTPPLPSTQPPLPPLPGAETDVPPVTVAPSQPQPPPRPPPPVLPKDVDVDSNLHTVPSDLEVLLSESEFLFSDA